MSIKKHSGKGDIVQFLLAKDLASKYIFFGLHKAVSLAFMSDVAETLSLHCIHQGPLVCVLWDLAFSFYLFMSSVFSAFLFHFISSSSFIADQERRTKILWHRIAITVSISKSKLTKRLHGEKYFSPVCKHEHLFLVLWPLLSSGSLFVEVMISHTDHKNLSFESDNNCNTDLTP